MIDPFINEEDFISDDASVQKAPIIKKRLRKKKDINLDGRTVDNILGLAETMAVSNMSKHSIDFLPIEHQIFDSVIDVSPILKEAVDKGDSVLKTYREFSADLFLSLYKPYPELIPPSEVHNNFILNNTMITTTVSEPHYAILKDYCQLDEFSAALASMTIHETITEKLRELNDTLKGAHESILDSINNAIVEEEDLLNLIEKAKALQQLRADIIAAGGNPDALKPLDDEVGMSLAEAMQSANDVARRLSKVSEDNFDQLEKIEEAISCGIQSAITQIAALRSYVEGWGFDSDSGSIRISFDNKLRAIHKIQHSPKLQKFTDLIGAFIEIAKKEQKIKTIHGTSDIVGVSVGRDIAKVLPSDKMLLNNEITKKDFLKRFSEGNLLQYQMNSTEKRGRGPIVVLLDDSGSMEGVPEIWAKSFAVALINVAQQQRRNFCYIPFDGSVRKKDIVIIEKGTLDPLKVVEMCELHYGGSTNFVNPLEHALRLLEDSMFKKGDIVFITDGDSVLPEKFLSKFHDIKKTKEFACRGVLINVGKSSVTRKSLDTFCDDVILLSDMIDFTSESAVVKQIFRDI